MKLLFVADPLEVFKTYKDTTFAMMREAASRGHELLACEPKDVVWDREGRVSANARLIALTGDGEPRLDLRARMAAPRAGGWGSAGPRRLTRGVTQHGRAGMAEAAGAVHGSARRAR